MKTNIDFQQDHMSEQHTEGRGRSNVVDQRGVVVGFQLAGANLAGPRNLGTHCRVFGYGNGCGSWMLATGPRCSGRAPSITMISNLPLPTADHMAGGNRNNC